ncbi:LptF/LptG family permease, partial [Escherichia coli]|nr:LptF/LptG family permease [Escherichia coli]
LLVRLPIYFYQMMPVSVLIGTVVALFRLVRSNEYVVIRTSGLSLLLIARTLMLIAIAAGLLVAACGEYLVPSSEKISQQFVCTVKA